MVDLEIRVGDISAPLIALVDSGADRTQVPADLLITVGIDHTTLPIIGQGEGAGSRFDVRICEAEIWFEKWKVCDRFLVSPPGNSPYALTGRYDFFQRFSDFFDWSAMPPVFDIHPIDRKKKP
jgi:hypothetical protein